MKALRKFIGIFKVNNYTSFQTKYTKFLPLKSIQKLSTLGFL